MNEKQEFEAKNLVLYFIITFIWSYSFWWILAALSAGPFTVDDIIYNILINIGVFGPMIGAFSVTYLREKKEGIIKLWKKFWNIDIKLKWLIITVFLYPLINATAFFCAILIDQKIPEIVYLAQPLIIIPTFLRYFFLGGPFNEEFGWRGYALGRLQVKWNAFISSLILGFIWGFWHLPLFYIPGTAQEGLPFVLYVITVMGLSILFTWVYNNTNGNVLIAMLFHQMYNFSIYLFPFTNTGYGIYFMGGFLFITTVLVVLIYKPEKLMK